MSGAHFGGRGAGRQRGNTAEIAPRQGGRRRGHGDGRHHPRPQRSFFSPNSDRRANIFPVTDLCSWNRPNISKAALVLCWRICAGFAGQRFCPTATDVARSWYVLIAHSIGVRKLYARARLAKIRVLGIEWRWPPGFGLYVMMKSCLLQLYCRICADFAWQRFCPTATDATRSWLV